MANKGFARSGSEEVINHYGAVRLRLIGSGSLKMKLLSLNDFRVKQLLALTMLPTTDVEPNRLANFTNQKARLELRITEINESFQISKILVFVRPVAKSYPE